MPEQKDCSMIFVVVDPEDDRIGFVEATGQDQARKRYFDDWAMLSPKEKSSHPSMHAVTFIPIETVEHHLTKEPFYELYTAGKIRARI